MIEIESRPDGELEVVVDDGALLVYGDNDLVDTYVRSLRDIAGDAIKVSGVNSRTVTDVLAVASTLTALQTGAGQYVRLSPDSVRKLADHLPMKGDNGFFRGIVTGADGKIVGQLQFSPATLLPLQAMNIEIAMVAMALRTAIASVEKAIARVEGKVDQVLALASADREGDVLGQHDAVRRIADTLDAEGVLPTSDWESISGLGPRAEVTIARLRKHIEKTLESFAVDAPVQDRAEHLKSTVGQNRLGETFQLLVVAESTLYHWQRLRVARVARVEPEHLSTVLDSARSIMREHCEQDGMLYTRAVEHLDQYSMIKPLEIGRFRSVATLKRDVAVLRMDLDLFAETRQTQVLDWAQHADPTPSDAINEVGRLTRVAGSSVKELGEQSVDVVAKELGVLGSKMQNIAIERAARRQPPGPQTTTD
jgi:hypothetical protein